MPNRPALSTRRRFLEGGASAAAALVLAPPTGRAASTPGTLRIGLAALRQADSVQAGVVRIQHSLDESRDKGVQIVCFAETYLPGLRNPKTSQPPPLADMKDALEAVRRGCAHNRVNAIVGMEWPTARGVENRAFVISAQGRVLGFQTKNQLAVDEDPPFHVPGKARQMFEVDGVRFGIVLCHEGWRFPETVRWAAVRGAKIVFQPQQTGCDRGWPWCASKYDPTQPWGQHFYEKAMQCRAEENAIYFASVNQTMDYQASATSLIGPDGKLVKHTPRGEEGLLVADLDLGKATGLYARRFLPELLR